MSTIAFVFLKKKICLEIYKKTSHSPHCRLQNKGPHTAALMTNRIGIQELTDTTESPRISAVRTEKKRNASAGSGFVWECFHKYW